MTETQKLPGWFRISARDYESPVGSYLIGDGREAGWAEYGRWVALRGILLETPGAAIDISDERAANALARRLGTDANGLFDMCCHLAAMGAIMPADWDRLVVVDGEIWNVQNSFAEKCRKLSENGRKGGRPPKKEAS